MGLFSWLTCENFCQCASRRRDGDLKWYDRPGYVLHYLMCFSCRRYRSQIDLIDDTISGCREELYEEEAPKEEDTLSNKAAMRIKDLLAEELAND